MASAKAIALMESIYTRVDAQVRAILATLPGVTVPAQQDGTVISAQRRIYNFEGDGVVVTDDTARRRVNIFIPGAPTTAPAATTFVSTVGAEKVFPLGTAPANWWLPAFVDSGWGNSVLESMGIGGAYTVAPTAAWVTASAVNGDNGTTDTQFLTRRTFTIPAGSITSVTLDFNYDDDIGVNTFGGSDGSAEGVWMNGHHIAGPFTRAGTPRAYVTVDIPISWVAAGASNVFAISVFSQAGANAVSFRITVNMNGAGADARYQLLSEKDQANGYAGLDSGVRVPTARLGSGTANTGTFLRGDQSWQATSTNSLSIKDIDGTPTVTATVLEFPNSTVTDQGGGVARYTPTAPTALPYVNVQDQKTQNTQGGGFTSGADQTRVLTTIADDSGSIASLSSNQISLPAGTYRFLISAPAHQVGAHQALLYNVTDTAVVRRGTSEFISANAHVSRSWISGRVVIAGTKAFEVRHRCQSTKSTDGFGPANNFGTEVYTVAEFWKEA